MGASAVGEGGGAPVGRRWVDVLAVAVAGLGQLVVLVPFTVALGLVAPAWAIVVGYVLWVVGAVVLVVTARSRPRVTPLVPAVNAALLWAFVTVGEAMLGWTA